MTDAAPQIPALPRILIVDDETDNLDAIKRLLRKQFEIFTSESGEAALEVMHSIGAVDVILSDQRMPGMSGSEFLEKAQEIDATPTRLLITGFADLEGVIDAINRGHIWRYIAKPWEPDDLRQTLLQAAERTRMRRSLDESRRDLERALREIRAKDWARERLFQILLHEFRTAPQILQSVKELGNDSASAPLRDQFLENLSLRFSAMEKDITDLFEDEKKVADLPKSSLLLSQLLFEVVESLGSSVTFSNQLTDQEPPLPLNHEIIRDIFQQISHMMLKNTSGAGLKIHLDGSLSGQRDLFVSWILEANKPTLPESLSSQNMDIGLAWRTLLEPFVGVDDFRHHSTGLRVQTARLFRQLSAMGGRADFLVSGNGTRVELLVVFKAF